MKFVLAILLLASATMIGGNTASAAAKQFCTYEACMPRCEKAGGKYCSAYCSKEVASRRAAGKCK